MVWRRTSKVSECNKIFERELSAFGQVAGHLGERYQMPSLSGAIEIGMWAAPIA